jgi:hypothetical protein
MHCVALYKVYKENMLHSKSHLTIKTYHIIYFDFNLITIKFLNKIVTE